MTYLILIFISLLGLLYISIPYLVDESDLKNEIIGSLEKKWNINIQYRSTEPVLFPYPGFILNDIRILDKEELILDIRESRLSLSLIPLLWGDLKISSIHLSDGKIRLVRSPQGDFALFMKFLEDEENSDTAESNDFSPDRILTKLPEGIHLSNIHVELEDLFYRKKYKLYIWKSILLSKPHKREIHLDFYGKLNDKKIEIYQDWSLDRNELSYNSLRFSGTVLLDKFNLSLLDDVFVIFPYADFKNAIVTGRLYFSKDNEDESSILVKDGLFQNFSYKKSPSLGKINISTKITYSYKLHKLGFENIEGNWHNKMQVTGFGYLTFTDKPVIYFKAQAVQLDPEHIRQIVGLWMDANLEKSVFFRGLPNTGYQYKYLLSLDINSQNLIYNGVNLSSFSSGFTYKYPRVNIRNLDFSWNEGMFQSNGFYDIASRNPVLEWEGNWKDMPSSQLLKSFSTSRYIRGKVNGDFKLESFGDTEKALFENARIKGNFQMMEGELLGYLNFLKPVASIGKFINLSGPPGNSLAFESLVGDFEYKKSKISLSNMKMRGVGLDATGSGRFSLEGDMDFQITLSLSGLAGKVIKLPIIYRGVFGKNLPYVDPVWLGTVYAGTIFLAGPAGAAVGGIAGSAASDYVNRFFTTVKGLWGSKAKMEE